MSTADAHAGTYAETRTSAGLGLPVRTHRLVHLYHADGHDVAALSGVDLVVGAGEMVGLLGPSGAGKSTLLGLLGGLFRPSAGRIQIGETDLGSISRDDLDRLRSAEVSLMLQGAGRNLLPYLDPAENVAFAQASARALLGRADDLPDPLDVLATVGLADHAHRSLADLTPGHLQLTAVAVAVAAQPGLLLADEPTSQLDHDVRDDVLDALARINRDLGTTILLVTHDPEVAARLPRTITIRDGRIGGEGRLGEEYAVVTADGFLPLPEHVQADLPPGTLVRFHAEGADYRLVIEEET